MSTDASDLREFLARRDVPCPVCRYNLRGLAGDRCPECGGGVSLESLSRVEVRLTRGWWFGFVPLALVALPAVPLMAIIGLTGVASVMDGNFFAGVAGLALTASVIWSVSRELRWLREADVIVALPDREQWRQGWMNWALLALILALMMCVAVPMGG